MVGCRIDVTALAARRKRHCHLIIVKICAKITFGLALVSHADTSFRTWRILLCASRSTVQHVSLSFLCLERCSLATRNGWPQLRRLLVYRWLSACTCGQGQRLVQAQAKPSVGPRHPCQLKRQNCAHATRVMDKAMCLTCLMRGWFVSACPPHATVLALSLTAADRAGRRR